MTLVILMVGLKAGGDHQTEIGWVRVHFRIRFQKNLTPSVDSRGN